VAQITLDYYQALPLHSLEGADDDSEVAYALAHGGVEGFGNTGGHKDVSQSHRDTTVPDVEHEFIIRLLSVYF